MTDSGEIREKVVEEFRHELNKAMAGNEFGKLQFEVNLQSGQPQYTRTTREKTTRLN